MEVEVIPEAVAKDEGVGAGGFGEGKEFTKSREFIVGDGEADHQFNWWVTLVARGKGGR